MIGSRTFLKNGKKHLLPFDAAQAVGRFLPNGPLGYRAKNLSYGPLRATRKEAEIDYISAFVSEPEEP